MKHSDHSRPRAGPPASSDAALREAAALHALDLLDSAERREFETLSRELPGLRLLTAEMQDLAAGIALTVPQHAAPDGMLDIIRSRTGGRVSALPPQRRSLLRHPALGWGVAAALAAGLFITWQQERSARRELNRLSTESQHGTAWKAKKGADQSAGIGQDTGSGPDDHPSESGDDPAGGDGAATGGMAHRGAPLMPGPADQRALSQDIGQLRKKLDELSRSHEIRFQQGDGVSRQVVMSMTPPGTESEEKGTLSRRITDTIDSELSGTARDGTAAPGTGTTPAKPERLTIESTQDGGDPIITGGWPRLDQINLQPGGRLEFAKFPEEADYERRGLQPMPDGRLYWPDGNLVFERIPQSGGAIAVMPDAAFQPERPESLPQLFPGSAAPGSQIADTPPAKTQDKPADAPPPAAPAESGATLQLAGTPFGHIRLEETSGDGALHVSNLALPAADSNYYLWFRSAMTGTYVSVGQLEAFDAAAASTVFRFNFPGQGIPAAGFLVTEESAFNPVRPTGTIVLQGGE